MEGSFGVRLRAQREQQQVPLADIAERTKIKLSLLEALERGDVSQWPTGIFRRSFVRAYAQAIGLDGDAVLREFLELYPEPVEEDVAAALVAAREGRRPPTRLGYLISSAINALPVRRKATPDSATRPADPHAVDTTDIPAVDPVFESSGGPVPALEMATANDGGLFDDERPGFADADASVEWTRDDAGRIASASFEDPRCETGEAPQRAAADEEPPAVETGTLRLATDDEQTGSARAASPSGAPDLAAVAALCTRLARALQPRDVVPVLEDAARVLDAVGLIVWMWDPATRTLGHVLAHGYSHDVLSRLPRVRWETDNAIADAFRSAETRVVRGSGTSTGAVVVPIVTGAGCAGVLAMELQDRGEERDWVRSVAAILAAQLAALFGFEALAEAVGA